jgi:hypothetical protein
LKTAGEECNIAWTDYQKAFDSVPHRWIEKSTELVGMNNKIGKLCKLSLEKWSTQLQLKQRKD